MSHLEDLENFEGVEGAVVAGGDGPEGVHNSTGLLPLSYLR